MGRSLKKDPFVDETLVKRVQQIKRTGDRKPVKTWSRRSTIIPDFVGVTVSIYNGRKFIPVFITENMMAVIEIKEFSVAPHPVRITLGQLRRDRDFIHFYPL